MGPVGPPAAFADSFSDTLFVEGLLGNAGFSFAFSVQWAAPFWEGPIESRLTPGSLLLLCGESGGRARRDACRCSGVAARRGMAYTTEKVADVHKRPGRALGVQHTPLEPKWQQQ
mmetsp:Transcript_4523/g.8110  ORF Transcript_4523/g.8110 Transcript_4523/m.8110 type:complete len:115 (+) Transcript_4523:1593-1937(+)